MADITLAQRILFLLSGPHDEELVYGINTGARNGGDFDDLLDACVTWWTANLDATSKTRVDLEGLRILEWNTAQGKFVQVAQREVHVDGGSVACLPPQCAAAVTWRFQDVDIPQRRRYNRCYIGYLATTSIESQDGRLTETARDSLRSDFVSLSGLIAVVNGQDPTLDGLCVTSVTGQFIVPATEVGVGLAVDTQRRRRNDYPDEKEYVAL